MTVNDMAVKPETLVVAALLTGNGYDEFIEVARNEEVFRDGHNKAIYQAIKSLAENGDDYSTGSVSNRLELDGVLRTLVPLVELHEIAGLVVTAADIKTYTRLALEQLYMTRLDAIGRDLQQKVSEGADVFAASELALRNIQSILERGTPDRTMHISRAVEEVVKDYSAARNNEETRFIPTGISSLDKALGGGIRYGAYAVVGARPSTGKTNAALNMILNMSQRHSIGFISAEMDTISITQRALAVVGGFDDQRLVGGYLSKDEQEQLRAACDEVRNKKVYINDSPNMPIAYVESLARKWRREKGIDVLVVDYLQLLDARKGRSREGEVADISRTLKKISRELEINVIVLAQLNRGVDRLPRMRDLRESGSIEQDADLIILLHSFEAENVPAIPEGYGQYTGMSSKDMLLMLVDKNRRGKRKVFAMVNFNKTTGRMRAMSQQERVETEPSPF